MNGIKQLTLSIDMHASLGCGVASCVLPSISVAYPKHIDTTSCLYHKVKPHIARLSGTYYVACLSQDTSETPTQRNMMTRRLYITGPEIYSEDVLP